MTIEEKIIIAKNARLGDGCFWKHPESVNWNIIFTFALPLQRLRGWSV